MIVICELETIYKDNKINQNAKNQIENMSESDQIKILSSTENISINSEILNVLLSTKAKINILTYSDIAEIFIEIGLSLANNETNKFIFDKNGSLYPKIKDIIAKKYEGISLTWDDEKPRKKRIAKTEKAKKETAPLKEEAPKELQKKSESIEEIKDAPKTKEKRTYKKKNSPKKITIDKVKSMIGRKNTDKEYEIMTNILNEVSNEQDLTFRCKIDLPILASDQQFINKMISVYNQI